MYSYWSFVCLLEEMSTHVLCPFLKWIFVFCNSCKIVLYIFIYKHEWLEFLISSGYMNSLLNIWLASTFFHSLGCLFTFFILSCPPQKFLHLKKSNLPFCCCCLCFHINSRNQCLTQSHEDWFLCFILRGLWFQLSLLSLNSYRGLL